MEHSRKSKPLLDCALSAVRGTGSFLGVFSFLLALFLPVETPEKGLVQLTPFALRLFCLCVPWRPLASLRRRVGANPERRQLEFPGQDRVQRARTDLGRDVRNKGVYLRLIRAAKLRRCRDRYDIRTPPKGASPKKTKDSIGSVVASLFDPFDLRLFSWLFHSVRLISWCYVCCILANTMALRFLFDRRRTYTHYTERIIWHNRNMPRGRNS